MVWRRVFILGLCIGLIYGWAFTKVSVDNSRQSDKPLPDVQEMVLNFSERGCVVVEGSDYLLGIREILHEGYCIELQTEAPVKSQDDIYDAGFKTGVECRALMSAPSCLILLEDIK